MCASSKRRVAVGFFDGVHLGHQAILETADCAVTFRNHPLSVIAPQDAPKLIMSLEERLCAIRETGVKEVTAVDFSPELAMRSCGDFALKCFGRPGETVIRAGADWRFGCGAEGDLKWLAGHGYDVETATDRLWNGERISSSRIREALAAGDVAAAADMLGRPYCLEGHRFSGKGKGAAIGFPTVNFAVSGKKEPIIPLGVYEAAVCGERAVVNFGTAPTFADDSWKEPVVEAHFLGTVPDVPEGGVDVRFLRFIRPEERFPSPDALRARIAADKSECLKTHFSNEGSKK